MARINFYNAIVNILHKTSTAQGDGTYALTWKVLYVAIAGRFNSIPVSERIIWDKGTFIADYNFFMEYKSGITTAMQLKYGARTFEIKSIVDWDESNKYLKLGLLEIK